jgi:hypothetical protein
MALKSSGGKPLLSDRARIRLSDLDKLNSKNSGHLPVKYLDNLSMKSPGDNTGAKPTEPSVAGAMRYLHLHLP